MKKRAEEADLNLTDPYLYKDEPGRGQKEILTSAQKARVVEITTQEKEL